MDWKQVKSNGMPVGRDKKKNSMKAIKKVEQNENCVKRAFHAVVPSFHVSAYAVYQAAACSVSCVCRTLKRPFESIPLHQGEGAHLQACSEEFVKTVSSHCCKGVE